MKNERVLAAVCAIAALTFLSACRSEVFDSYSVGYSTPAGNEIWIQEVRFDDKWGLPGGGLACCWEEITAGASVFNKPMPHSVHVQWLQEDRKVVYAATVQLPDDLGERARKLPPFTWISDGKRDIGLYLIIGMQPTGGVTVWLSNIDSSANVKGRVLEVVGRARARSRPWRSPD